MRLSALNFCALTLRTVDRSLRSLGKPGSLIERLPDKKADGEIRITRPARLVPSRPVILNPDLRIRLFPLHFIVSTSWSSLTLTLRIRPARRPGSDGSVDSDENQMMPIN